MISTLRTIVAGAAIVTAVAVAPVTALAFMGDDGPGPGGGHLKQMAKELQLTPQQQQQLKDIFAKSRPQGEPLRKQFMEERGVLHALTEADTIDDAAIRAQVAKMSAVAADMAVHRAHVSREIRAILTPEQIAKQKELQEQRDKRMNDRPGRAGKRLRQGQ